MKEIIKEEVEQKLDLILQRLDFIDQQINVLLRNSGEYYGNKFMKRPWLSQEGE